MNMIDIQLAISASPEEVFEALTNAGSLKTWFAEEALVNPDENIYSFWGKYTPELPDQDSGTHTMLSYEPHRYLKFDWKVKGADTTVEITLSPHQTGTLLSLMHHDVPSWKLGDYSIEDFWRTSLENLRCWVERKTVGAFCDFSQKRTGDIQLSIEISASPEKVFESLSDPDQMERYIANDAKVDLQVGGAYSFGWGSMGPHKILEVEPAKKLSYSWADKDDPSMVVTWALEGSENRTRLTLIHSGFAEDDINIGYSAGWTAYMNAMKSMVERGPSWERPLIKQSDYAQ